MKAKVNFLHQASVSLLAHKVASQYLAAQNRSAAREIFWHGTTSKYLQRILKQGLIPDPKELQYTEEFSGNAGRSIRTFGGIYLTDNWSVADSFALNASRRKGGNPLIVAMTYETRTHDTWADEDDLLPIVESVSQLSASNRLTDAVTFWGSQFRSQKLISYWLPGGFNPSVWPKVVQVILTADLSELLVKFWKQLLDAFPRLQGRYPKQKRKLDALAADVFRSLALHMLENNYIQSRKALQESFGGYLENAKEYGDTYRAELELLDQGNPPAEMQGTFSRLQQATDALSAALPEITDPSAQMEMRHNIRLKHPLTFRGKNRILSITEHVPQKTITENWPVTDIHVRYGPVLPEYIAEYERVIGSTYRLLHKGRVVKHSLAKYDVWPEDVWGPKP